MMGIADVELREVLAVVKAGGGGHLYFVDLRDECGGGANEESFLDQHFGL